MTRPVSHLAVTIETPRRPGDPIPEPPKDPPRPPPEPGDPPSPPPEPGDPPTPDTPLSGQRASIYVIKDGHSEVFAGHMPVPEMGKAIAWDIDLSGADLDATSAVDGRGFGGLCGTMGMISLSWIGLGLMTLRRIASAPRRRK